jgi:beta-lactamase superfamily II metal-dependent hydrolase
MTLITTPSKTILHDCRVTDEDESRILSYLDRYIPARGPWDLKHIDWFICSHRDRDHIHGLQKVNERFEIRGIVDPGTTSGSTESDENKYYVRLRREVKDKFGEDALRVPEASLDPYFDFDGALFYCFASGKGQSASEDGHYGNNVFTVEYAGRRVLLPGDSDWRAWKDQIMPTFSESGLLESTLLVASHHGSRSFFLDSSLQDEDAAWQEAYEDHLTAIAPTTTVISCGPQSVCNHPNPEALRRYREASQNGQVFLTRHKGTLIGRFHADGTWTLTPARFLQGWTYANWGRGGRRLDVTCKSRRNGAPDQCVKSGDALRVGTRLVFEAITAGGFDPRSAEYTFEVSNGGRGLDADHDEIYDKESSEPGPPHRFSRDLSYVGTHLLRCVVRQGSYVCQRVFEVTGLP